MINMLFMLLTSNCTAITSCVKCIDQSCNFCHKKTGTSQNMCISSDQSCENENYIKYMDKNGCLDILGGDAKPSVRYIIGSLIVIIAIAVDVSFRLFARSQARENYDHL